MAKKRTSQLTNDVIFKGAKRPIMTFYREKRIIKSVSGKSISVVLARIHRVDYDPIHWLFEKIFSLLIQTYSLPVII